MAGKIFVSFTIVSTSNFFLIAREKDAPLAEVYRSDVLTPPHIQRNVTISPVNPVMHSVELWTTIDNINPDTLRARCDIDASITNTVAFEYIQFIVGRSFPAPYYDPLPDQPEYNNPDLLDKDYLVHKSGFGVLVWGRHIEKMPTGGFQFIDGQLFSSNEEYTIQINNLVTSTDTSGGTGSYPDNIVEITGDTAFGTAHYNKLIEVNSVNSNVVLSIADLNTVPELTKFSINTHNGQQIYTTLALPSGKYCLINGVQKNKVHIGKAEVYSFIKKGDYLRLLGEAEGHKRLGQRVKCDGIPPANSLPETGGWYAKTTYVRIYEDYVNQLPLIELGVGADDVQPDAVNRTKWIIGVNKIWVPDRGGYFDRATDPDGNIDSGGTRLSGNVQVDGNKAHTHVVQIPPDKTAQNQEGSGRIVGGAGGGFEPAALNSLTSDSSGDTEAKPKNVATNIYRLI